MCMKMLLLNVYVLHAVLMCLAVYARVVWSESIAMITLHSKPKQIDQHATLKSM